MEMSAAFPTQANSWKSVIDAEQLGYTRAWFYDTPLVCADIFAAMAVAAVKTSKIELYSGVMIPSNRIAPTAAAGLATLNALAPGRIGFGISTGFTARRTMGMRPVTLECMVKYLEDVKGLLSGDMVEWEQEGATHKINLIDPDFGSINIADPIPLAISALGPKGRAITAESGAQWITGSTTPEQDKALIDDMRRMWVESGRDLSDFFAILSVGGRVLDEGESADSELCMAQAGCFAAILFHAAVEAADFGIMQPGEFPCPDELEQYRKVYETYMPADARYLSNHRGHLMYVRPEETHLTGDVIKKFTMVGTKKEMVERFKAIKEMGYHQIQFHIAPGHERDMLQRWASVMAEVNA